MKETLDDIQARESRHVLQTYKRQPIAFVRGSGPRLYDVDGREYYEPSQHGAEAGIAERLMRIRKILRDR